MDELLKFVVFAGVCISVIVVFGLLLRKIGVSDDTITRWMPSICGSIIVFIYGINENVPIYIAILISAATFLYARIIGEARIKYQANKKKQKEEQEINSNKKQ